MNNPTWALCNISNCNKNDTCERFNKNGKMLYNMFEVCLKNEFKLYIEQGVELGADDENVNN